MNVSITLGRWLNDDGTISKILENRLLMTLELINEHKVDKVVVSGGIANTKAGISEASAMKSYLLSKGVKEDMIIVEDKSETTNQNFQYSLPKVLGYKPKIVYIVSSNEHFTHYNYNPIKMYTEWLNKYKEEYGIEDIRLVIYTDTNSFD